MTRCLHLIYDVLKGVGLRFTQMVEKDTREPCNRPFL